MKKIFTTCIALFTAIFLVAQSGAGFWQDVNEAHIVLPEGTTAGPAPAASRILSLDMGSMVNYLRLAPMEFNQPETQSLELRLPAPDGHFETFAVWESPVLEPGLSAAFPMIKTYGGKSTEKPGVTLRFSCTLEGFNAIVQTGKGTWFISTYARGQQQFYRSYWLKDVLGSDQTLPEMACGVDHPVEENTLETDLQTAGTDRNSSAPVNLYTYRLAMATTAEYSSAHGGTPASVLSAVTNVINQVNSVYERDNAIRLILIDSTTNTFFFPPGINDPYTNSNASTMAGENPAVLNAAYGSNGYDVGHVFGTSNGGVVGIGTLGSVCSMPTLKGRAASNIILSASNVFYITVAHEFGHQFNAFHTFNLCNNNNEEPLTAYEPGGGSTIMSYTGEGVCGDYSLQDVADAYFHINSMDRIRAFSRNVSTGGACAQVVPTDNNTPEVTLPYTSGFSIPIGTPFEVTGQATDPDGDILTYNWEQYDLGPASPLGAPMGTAPLFRSTPPSASPTRVFPKMLTIVENVLDLQEVLPSTSRIITLRFTARDNHPEAGGYDSEELQFNAVATAGPFVVTQPDLATTWEVGQYTEVTWDVANTDAAPVNSQFVNIRLSTDGGFNYPIMLLAQTPNDGSAFITVPDELTTTARVRVEAADNIFFDISNEDFSIIPAVLPGFSLESSPEYGIVCIPGDFEIDLQTTALQGFSEAITFSVTGLPAGATASFSQNPVTPGNQATLTIHTDGVEIDGNYTITIQAQADGVPVTERTVDINFVNSDFSALLITSPEDGASGISGLPTFTWTALPNALTYDIQIATDPAFNNIVSEAYNLTSPSFTSSVMLEDNTIYYWRIMPANECGSVGFLDPASFHTVSQSCQQVESTGGTVQISSLGLPYIQSKINITQSGTISDINLKNIKGKHEAIADLAFRLKNPAGDTVTLLSALPCNSQDFNFGFNDESPNTTVPCPPNSGNSYKPVQPLSTFAGQDVAGEWTLIVAVINTLGNGGNFEGWSMEYCAALTPQNPVLVKNDTLAVPPGEARLIYQNRLEVEDADNPSAELQFTIVKNTEHGSVRLNGQPLGTGDHFTMFDVYASAVEYQNTNPDATYDYFTFAVNDGNGGYLGTPRFNIVIDPDADPSSVQNVHDANEFSLYPNPAANEVTLQFKRRIAGQLTATLLNAQGQALMVEPFRNTDKIRIDTATLPGGIYFVQVRTPEGILTKKLLIGK